MNTIMSYARHDDSGVWQRTDAKPITYADGHESRIFEIIEMAKDVGVLSDELNALISDWPTEYHFSRSRHCLLRPLDVKPGDRVLELGCGCGALTRYLGECGAHVDAVEGSPLRAKAAAARCRDLSNVRVFIDDLTRFSSDSLYDWVLLIGVLEYAPAYSDAADPVNDYMMKAASHLSPEGRLVIAIENKLGVKYFNGCSEDHLGRQYYGIQGLYATKEPITFGKQELQLAINKAGLANCEFLYPFPDYKLPSCVLTNEAIAAADFDSCTLLPWRASRDYIGKTSPSFSERLVQHELFANGCLADFANSFVVVATKAGSPIWEPNALAWAFDVECQSRLATQTIVRRSPPGISLDQELLIPSDDAPAIRIKAFDITRRLGSRCPPDTPCNAGAFARNCARDGFQTQCANALIPWFQWLLRQSDGTCVDGNVFDETPLANAKWQSNSPVPITWVLVRAINRLLTQLSLPDNPEYVRSIVNQLYQTEGIDSRVDQKSVDDWLEQEHQLQNSIRTS